MPCDDEDDATCLGTKQQYTNNYVHTSMNNERGGKIQNHCKKWNIVLQMNTWLEAFIIEIAKATATINIKTFS